MLEYLKRVFCKHGNMKIISELEWVSPGWDSSYYHREKRNYIYCPKCGYKRKITRRL